MYSPADLVCIKQLGMSKYPKQSITEAIELLQKAIELDTTYAEAYSALGFIFSIIRKYDKGVTTAEQAVDLNPNSADAHMLGSYTQICWQVGGIHS